MENLTHEEMKIVNMIGGLLGDCQLNQNILNFSIGETEYALYTVNNSFFLSENNNLTTNRKFNFEELSNFLFQQLKQNNCELSVLLESANVDNE